MPGTSQSIVYKNAKVITIGNSGTGKSMLNRALAGKPFVPEISDEKRQIYMLNRQEHLFNDGCCEVRETFLWDPGGRPGSLLAHQLYLHDANVALIVLDIPNDGDIEMGVREWVRAVHRIKGQHSRPVRMFLVITRKDRGGVGSRFSKKIQDLKKKFGFDDVFETSAKEGLGIEGLRKSILEAIDWEKQPGLCSMTLLQGMQNFLSDRKQEEQQLFLEEELYKAFEKLSAGMVDYQDIDPHAQFEICIGCLEVQGEIRWFHTDKYMLLEPELLDIYASRLIDEARDDPDDFGCIDENSAQRERFALPIGTERVKNWAFERILLGSIVDDFLSYKIAFRGYKDGSLIFPSQSMRENYNPPDPEQMYYIFHFVGEVIAIYSTLAVRLAHSEIFVKDGMWANAVTYTVGTGNLCGIYLSMQGETQGRLTLFFGDGVSEKTRKLFAAYVIVHLTSYDKNASGKPVLRCPAPNCGIVFTEDQEKRAYARHEGTITCPVCKTSVKLPVEEAFTTPLAIQQPAAADLLRHTQEIRSRKALGNYDALLCCNDDEQDKQAVGWIYDRLEEHGIVVWFAERDLRPGSDKIHEIEQQIEQQIKNSPVAVVCFGNSNCNHQWLQMQKNAILRRFNNQEDHTIIPVLLEHASPEKPESLLSNLVWIDFHKKKPDPIDQLVWGIRGEIS